jgi:hypothetical protein
MRAVLTGHRSPGSCAFELPQCIGCRCVDLQPTRVFRLHDVLTPSGIVVIKLAIASAGRPRSDSGARERRLGARPPRQ